MARTKRTQWLICVNSSTFADALRNLERYLRVFTEGFQFHGSVDDNTLVLAATPLDACVYNSRQAQDFAVATILTASRAITHRNLAPMWAEVYHAPPRDPATAERLLAAPILYARARLAIVAPRSWLELQIEHADNRLLRVLEGYCREILTQREEIDDPFVKVERWLVSRLPSGSIAAAEAARELGMSPRTLARRLRERGTNFAALASDLRRRLALRYVEDRSLRLSQIAYLLGYSEPSAFNHAFRRWTGRSPNAYRGPAPAPDPERVEAVGS